MRDLLLRDYGGLLRAEVFGWQNREGSPLDVIPLQVKV